MKNNAISKLQQAHQAFIQGNHKKANKLISTVEKKGSKNEQVLRGLVSLYRLMGEDRKALLCCEEIFYLHPEHSTYLQTVVSEWRKFGEYSRILKLFKKYTGDLTHNYELLTLKLARELEMARYELAANTLAKIESSFPNKTRHLPEKALLLSELRQENLAIDVYKELLRLNPENATFRFNYATLLQSAGKLEIAKEQFMQAYSLDGCLTEALVRYFYCGRVNMTIPQFERAKQLVSDSRTSPLDREKLSYALGKCYDDNKQYEKALQYYKQANQLNRERIGPFNLKAFDSLIDELMTIDDVPSRESVRENSSLQPIFIVGHFRSGSTLVEQILAASNQVSPLGEIEYWLRCSLDLNWKLKFGSGSKDSNQAVDAGEGYLKCIQLMSPKHRLFTDKRPENILFLGRILTYFPNAKFIVTERNLLDNALSVYFQQMNDLSTFSTDLNDFFFYNQRIEKLKQHWFSKYSDSIIRVRYEDLVADPISESRRLANFLSIEWNETMLDFSQNKTSVRTASAAQVRNHIYKSSVGRSQNYQSFLDQSVLKNYI